MRLPGYTQEENEFYERAEPNYDRRVPHAENGYMNESGPVRVSRVNVDAAREAGLWPPAGIEEAREAHARFPDGDSTETPSLKEKEVNDITKQGRDRPRPLTHDETELSRVNRRQAKGDLIEAEKWYRRECRDNSSTKEKSRARRAHSLGRNARGDFDTTLTGVTHGDAVWKPIAW